MKYCITSASFALCMSKGCTRFDKALLSKVEGFTKNSFAFPSPPKTRINKSAGFTLLPVMLAMSLIAAIAFLLNRDNGMNIDMVASQMDADRARYAAEAGLQAVNSKVQSLSCAGGFPVVGSPITNSSFGGASYSAYATTASGNTTSLSATGSYNGTTVTLTRNNIYVYQTTPKTYTLQPGAAAGIDTYIDLTTETNYGSTNSLAIKKNQQSLLFKFDLSAFPAGSRPVSATFSAHASGGLLGGVELYRMTSDWVEGTGSNSPLDGATWKTKNGSTAWATPGGDFYPVKLTAKITTSSWVDFEVTDLANAWLSGQYPNYGVIILSTGELGTFKYASSDDSNAANRPKITFNYLLPCGTTGPSDPVGATVTLKPTADSFNDSGAALANNGVATTIKTYYTPARENRILMQFDTSSIAAGTVVQSATLRMYVNAVGSSTTNTKSIWANAINEAWIEGAGNNTNKSCPTTTAGTSWSYRTNCTNWAFIHPPNTLPAWTTMTKMPTARTNHVVATVNNKIYTIGGYNPVGGYFNTVEEYDPATNTWATKAPMPTIRSDAAAAVVNGKIYVIGGTSNGTTALKTNEMYDPATNTWTAKANMTTARMFLSAAAANNKIYAIGGANTTVALKINEEYDPVANTWATKTQMTTARTYLSAQSVNGKVYAIGGWTGTLSLTNNEMYDPGTNTWVAKAALPIGTDSMGSATLGNKIYLIGGMRGAAATKAVLMYDTLNNVYTIQLNYPVATDVPAAAALNGYIYSLGGDNGISTVYQTHYQFDSGTPVPVATASDESTAASPLAANFNKGWIIFDLKPLVQEWVDGVRPNNGLVIYTEVADQFSISSRENSANKPELIVTY